MALLCENDVALASPIAKGRKKRKCSFFIFQNPKSPVDSLTQFFLQYHTKKANRQKVSVQHWIITSCSQEFLTFEKVCSISCCAMPCKIGEFYNFEWPHFRPLKSRQQRHSYWYSRACHLRSLYWATTWPPQPKFLMHGEFWYRNSLVLSNHLKITTSDQKICIHWYVYLLFAHIFFFCLSELG